MAANTLPIFGRTPDIQVAGLILGQAAATGLTTNMDGTGTLISIFQADPTEGGYVDRIIVKIVGTVSSQTVIRIFYCSATGAFTSGTTNTTANTSLIAELTVLATNASNSQAQTDYIIPLKLPMPAGTRLLFGCGTTTNASVGNGFAVTTVGAKF